MHSENDYLTLIGTFQDKRTQMQSKKQKLLKSKI